jgi:hypothetical protein
MLIAVTAPVLGYVGYRHWRSSKALEEFKAHGGFVLYENVAPYWLRDLAGDEIVEKIPLMRRDTGQHVPGAVCFSSDGVHFASWGEFGDKASVWRLSDMKPVFQLEIESDGIGGIEFSQCGTLLAVEHFPADTKQAEIQLWSVSSREFVGAIQGHLVRCAGTGSSFLNENTLAVSYRPSDSDQQLHLWNLNPLSLRQKFVGHEVPIQEVTLSPDRRSMVSMATVLFGSSSANREPELCVWDVECSELRGSFSVGVFHNVEFSRDGRSFLVYETKRVTLRDATDGQILKSLQLGDAANWTDAVDFCYLGDGNVVVAREDGALKPLDGATYQGDISHSVVNLHTGSEWEPLKDLGRGYSALKFSPTGDQLAAGSIDGSIQLCDVYSGKRTTLTGDDTHGWPWALEFSRDRRFLACVYDFGSRVWNLQTAKMIVEEPGSWFDGFSPNCEHCSMYGRVLPPETNSSTLWDLPSGKRRPFVRW